MVQVVPVLLMIAVWIVPIVLIWWMVKTLNSIRVDVHRIADEVATTGDRRTV